MFYLHCSDVLQFSICSRIYCDFHTLHGRIKVESVLYHSYKYSYLNCAVSSCMSKNLTNQCDSSIFNLSNCF